MKLEKKKRKPEKHLLLFLNTGLPPEIVGAKYTNLALKRLKWGVG